MDERGVVEELDAGGEADRLVAHDTEGLASMQGQPGAHSLAPGFEVIPGGAQCGGLAGGHTGPRRHPDKHEHQPFDLEEGGVGGGVHRVGRIPGVTVRKILGAGSQDVWIRKSDNGA